MPAPSGLRPAGISAFDLSNTRILTIGTSTIGYVTLEQAEGHWRLRKIYPVPVEETSERIFLDCPQRMPRSA